MLLPVPVVVTPVQPAAIGVLKGEVFVREWLVENLGIVPIRNPELVCVAGDPCSKQ